MTNKLRCLFFVSAVLCFASFGGISSSQAKDITVSLANDSTTLSLSRNYTVKEVRTAIEFVREGDYEKAVPTLLEYAQKGDTGATYVLGKLYANGLGVDASATEAAKLFTANSANGHAPSMMALAGLKQSSNPAEALYLIKQADGAGDLAATAQLGKIYENGALGVAKNPKHAFKYYQRASDEGVPIAKFHLARLYDNGIGVSANEVQSTRLYRQAALSGVAVANAVMARRYFEGKGLESDPIAGVGWLTRGAQLGSSDAMVVLGERYELGDTLKQDLNMAGRLYSQAAKMGDPAGIYKLATFYLKGLGTKPDPVRAYVLLSNPQVQVLPKAKALFDKLETQLSPTQLATARKKLKEQTQESATQK